MILLPWCALQTPHGSHIPKLLKNTKIYTHILRAVFADLHKNIFDLPISKEVRLFWFVISQPAWPDYPLKSLHCSKNRTEDLAMSPGYCLTYCRRKMCALDMSLFGLLTSWWELVEKKMLSGQWLLNRYTGAIALVETNWLWCRANEQYSAEERTRKRGDGWTEFVDEFTARTICSSSASRT